MIDTNTSEGDGRKDRTEKTQEKKEFGINDKDPKQDTISNSSLPPKIENGDEDEMNPYPDELKRRKG